MNRTVRRQRRKREHAPRPVVSKPTSDRAIYNGIAIVGFFVVVLGWLFTEGQYWRQILLGYLFLTAYLINLNTFRATRGRPLTNFGASLARIPLRFVGYGTKDGKPLEAAHDHPETKKALLISILVSVVMLAVLAVILLPGLRR